MKNQDNRSKDAADLRQKAELLARERRDRTLQDSAALSPEEIRETLHELRVHQIEMELQNEELRTVQEEIEESRARYFDLYNMAPVGYTNVSEKGLVLEANLTASTLLGVDRGKLVKQPLSRFILKEDQDIYYLHRKKLIETGMPQECELRMVKPNGTSFWAHLTATATQAEDGAPVLRIAISDITKRKKAEGELKRIAWMLSRKPIMNIESHKETHDQVYGDLTALNSDGIILKSIGRERLNIFANDYHELLETSSAVYEANGDYAFGIFTSGWCRMMDSASRNLCNTPNNAEALDSGRWLCHESCWTDCAKEAIARREHVDIECQGGIRMYAVPIFAQGNVIGAINFGYGDPPKDPEKLKLLAEAYHLNYDDLLREANAYDSRPPYIIEMAKKRLNTTAKLIGTMVEAKQAMEALQESETKYRTLLDGAPDSIARFDRYLRHVFINRKATEELGMSTKDFIGKTNRELGMPQNVAEKWEAGLRAAFQEKEQIVDIDIETPHGFKHYTSRIVPEYSQSGNVNTVLSITRDITERRQAEDKLVQNHALLSNLARLVPGVIYQYRLYPDGRSAFPYSSPGMNDIYEYTPEEVREDATPVFGRLHPDDFDMVSNAIQESARSLEEFYCAFRVILPRQGLRWRWSQAHPERTEDGGTLWHGIISDITERKQAEEALANAAKEWRATFDSITDMIAIIDSDRKILRVNQAFARAFDSTPEKVIGKHCYKIVHDLKAPHPLCAFDCALSTNKTCSYELFELKLDKHLECDMSPLKDGKGNIAGVVHIFKDITQRKNMETEKQSLRNKAEVSSRLATVGEMAAGIAHEINNPLTAVIGFSELLAQKDLPPETEEYVKYILIGSNRVKDIVRRLLTFARQSKPFKTKTDVHELIDNTLEIRSYVLKTANIAVIKEYDPELPWVTVDPGQMQQVFLNIIVNAEHAMKKSYDGGILTVTTQKSEDHVTISFKDDGPGIPEEVVSKIFNPFFTTKDPGEGTGLGLSLSRSIILDHNGDIEVESKPGEGTTFTISLPLSQNESQTEPELPKTAHLVKPKTTANILVVDDEPAIRALIIKILTAESHLVTETGSPYDALELIRRNNFDVILLDIRMPGMSGKELYAKITEEFPKMANRVIFITGDTSDMSIRGFLKEKDLVFIVKPFDMTTLLEKVNEVLLRK